MNSNIKTWWQIATVDAEGTIVRVSEVRGDIKRVRTIAKHSIKLPLTSKIVVTEFVRDALGLPTTTGRVARYSLGGAE